MKHFNIDKVALVESTAADADPKFCYGEDNFLLTDFSYYDGKSALFDLSSKQNPSRFKRAIFLHKLISEADNRSLTCFYHNYNMHQLATNGAVTICANHGISFTMFLSVATNRISFRSTRFAHVEHTSMLHSEKHVEKQLEIIKAYQKLLTDVNIVLYTLGPKINKLFK